MYMELKQIGKERFTSPSPSILDYTLRSVTFIKENLTKKKEQPHLLGVALGDLQIQIATDLITSVATWYSIGFRDHANTFMFFLLVNGRLTSNSTTHLVCTATRYSQSAER